MSFPTISILTPVLNAAPTLAESLSSALDQDPPAYEILVQDGGSTDGSTALWQARPEVKGWCEPDGGLYDAMNRLLHRAQGEWVVFLQADDWLEPGALAAWGRGVAAHPSADIITGGARTVTKKNGGWQQVWARESFAEKEMTPENLTLGEPMLNARMFRRQTLLDLGGFDLRWQLASDRDLLLRLQQRSEPKSVRAVGIPENVYRYRWHAASRTMNPGSVSAQKLTRENLEIAEVRWPGSDPGLLPCLRRWHLRESLRLAMNALEAGQARAFFEAVVRGTRYSPAWPLHFAKEFSVGLLGVIRRGGRTRSQCSV